MRTDGPDRPNNGSGITVVTKGLFEVRPSVWIGQQPGFTPAAAGDRTRRPRLSAVVPCYDEADNLAELHRRLGAVCAQAVGDDYELVLVDDGSRDATAALFAELARRDPHFVGVVLSRNHGHQLALTAGLSVARGERVLILDADLQDPPELLGEMMAALDRGADVAYGQRVERQGEGRLKLATAGLFYRVLRSLTEVDIPVDAGDFRLISRRALDAFLAMPEQHRFVRGMVSWLGFEQVAVPYARAVRFRGRSNYPWRRMLRLAGDAITGFSVRPLRLANYLGVLMALGALGTLGYTLLSWASGQVVPGWTSVMTVVLVLGSFQMLVLAIMCEYLGRLFIEVKRRPLFLVDRVLRGEELAMQTPAPQTTTGTAAKGAPGSSQAGHGGSTA